MIVLVAIPVVAAVALILGYSHLDPSPHEECPECSTLGPEGGVGEE